jgi:hypothetical protein
MVGKSFPSLAGPIFPRPDARKLALLCVAAAVVGGCGGSGGGKKASPSVQRLRGDAFAFTAPAGWQVSRGARSLAARKGAQLVSVTIFRLARQVTPALRARAVAELDRVAARLAAQEGGKVENARDEQVAGRDARAYDIVRSGDGERIAFVLVGRREYQLYCRGTGEPCTQLFTSFTLSG